MPHGHFINSFALDFCPNWTQSKNVNYRYKTAADAGKLAPGIRENSVRRCLYHSIIWRKKTKQILKIILSLGAAELSLLCGLNAEKLFVKNLGLLTIPIPNREIEPYTVITEDMFTTTELTGYIKDFDYGKNLLFLLMNRFYIKTDINKAITKAAQNCEKI